MTYQIMINEGQRRVLAKALLAGEMQRDFEKHPGTGCGGYDTELEEAQALRDMLENLERDEKESPGCLHGFCL